MNARSDPYQFVEFRGVGKAIGQRFHHESLFYAGDDGFLEGTLPFINAALAAQEPVLVAVANEKIELLKEALGGDAQDVRFADMHRLGRNPARVIPCWRRFLDVHAPGGRPARGIGEPTWPGRRRAELTECQRHESLSNLAFEDGQPWRLLCPYDLDGLDDDVIEAAKRTHPFVALDGGSERSEAYLHPQDAPGPFDGLLPPPAAHPAHLEFTEEDLRGLRSFVSTRASATGLDADLTEHLVLAANELATNSVRYGGGWGTLRIWAEDETLMCEVEDHGQIDEPMAGLVQPMPNQDSGRGLWLVNQLCDLVQIRSTPSGTVVRVHMPLPERVPGMVAQMAEAESAPVARLRGSATPG